MKFDVLTLYINIRFNFLFVFSILFFQAVLAGVIVVALKGMLLQMLEFWKFWKLSKVDALVWMGTFLTVVLINIDIGLLCGIVLSLAAILFLSFKPNTCLLGHVPNTDFYLDIARYKAVSLTSFLRKFPDIFGYFA